MAAVCRTGVLWALRPQQCAKQASTPVFLALTLTHPPHPLPCAPAWNNLGDAYEKQKKYGDALSAYKEVLTYAPDNKARAGGGLPGGRG